MSSERIKADQVDSSCIFLGGVREIYESSGLLVHPVKDPAIGGGGGGEVIEKC